MYSIITYGFWPNGSIYEIITHGYPLLDQPGTITLSFQLSVNRQLSIDLVR